MDSKEAFVELLEQVKALRAAGVAKASFDGGALLSVEFFEQKVPTFAPLDLDTIIPPAPQHAAPAEGEEEGGPISVAPALARLLRNGSVS